MKRGYNSFKILSEHVVLCVTCVWSQHEPDMTHVSVLCCQQLLDDNVKAMHDSVTEHHFREIKDPCCKLVKFWFLSQRRPAEATRGH